jgi:hypothetical protein
VEEPIDEPGRQGAPLQESAQADVFVALLLGLGQLPDAVRVSLDRHPRQPVALHGVSPAIGRTIPPTTEALKWSGEVGRHDLLSLTTARRPG